MSPLTKTIALLFFSSGLASADVVTVTFSGQNKGGGLGTVDGLDLPGGSLLRLGYFDIDNTNVLKNQNDIGLLDAAFTIIAETMVDLFGGETILDEDGNEISNDPGESFGSNGAFGHSVTYDPVPNKQDGKKLVLWAFNAEAIGKASAHGIFSDDDWVTPSSLTLNFDLSSVDPFDPDGLYIGTEGPETSGSVGGPLNKLVAIESLIVPEPSSVLLILASGGLLALRRFRC
jgi:hypothetical protein